jgi:hypothetical protein
MGPRATGGKRSQVPTMIWPTPERPLLAYLTSTRRLSTNRLSHLEGYVRVSASAFREPKRQRKIVGAWSLANPAPALLTNSAELQAAADHGSKKWRAGTRTDRVKQNAAVP